METRLANGVINRWTHLLTLVKGNRSHLMSLCKISWSRFLTLCEGSRRCLVFLRSRSTDGDYEETAFFAAESYVIDQEHDERVWATLDEGCNAVCHSASWAARAERYFDMFGFQSEYREGTRNKVFTGLGGNTVAAVGRRKFPFALAFTAKRGDIHHLSGTIESWELPGDGPFLFPIDAQAKSGLIKDMARSRIFIENKPGFYLRMYKDAKTGLMLTNVADFDLLNDQALTPQLLRASKPMYALAATIQPPTCLTGGTNASGEHVDIPRSLTRLPGNHTFRFTHVAIGLDVMDEISWYRWSFSPLHQ